MDKQVETGTRLATAEPAFHADDTLQVADYRTVSALALFSLLFGLASPLCLAWPLLAAFPLIGAVLSIVAIRRIDRSEGALTGRWAAIMGLVLCVASGAAAVSRSYVMRTIRTQQAEVFGREWLELLLAGNQEKAFLLTVEGNRREPPPQPGLPAPTQSPYERFLDRPGLAELVAAGGGADVQFVEMLHYEPQPRRQFLIQHKYRVAPREAAKGKPRQPLEVILTLQRAQLAAEHQSRWLVTDFQAPQAAATAHVH